MTLPATTMAVASAIEPAERARRHGRRCDVAQDHARDGAEERVERDRGASRGSSAAPRAASPRPGGSATALRTAETVPPTPGGHGDGASRRRCVQASNRKRYVGKPEVLRVDARGCPRRRARRAPSRGATPTTQIDQREARGSARASSRVR